MLVYNMLLMAKGDVLSCTKLALRYASALHLLGGGLPISIWCALISRGGAL